MVSSSVVAADGSMIDSECCIIREHFMELFINEKLVMKLVCIPSDLPELVMGRMISEGYIESADDVEMIYICDRGRNARVFLKESAGAALELVQAAEEVPTCCTDNKVFFQNANAKKIEWEKQEDADSDSPQIPKLQKAEWKPEWIFRLADEFASGSKMHSETQGTHSCYLSVKGEIVFFSEDIGRHNAMDKAIGYAIMHGYERETCILYITGRVSTDMVKKAIMSRIPVLVSKSVTTDAAINMARAYNLTLICKAWPDRYEIFYEANSI